MTAVVDALAGQTVRVTSVRLGPGPAAHEIVQRMNGASRLVCLIGKWAGGGALVTADPVVVLPPDADPSVALAAMPSIESPDPDVVGGGWFGSVGYDGGHVLAFYDWVLRYADGEWYFETLQTPQRADALAQRRSELMAMFASPTPAPAWRVGRFAGPSRLEHLAAVERAVAEIRAGEIYQVNVCTRLAARVEGDPLGIFASAVATLRPAYGAFVAAADGALISLSPELFLRRRAREVVTSPIKGTRPRDNTRAGADELRGSVKDAAENVMIVDLMRNDLGRVCVTGTVAASSLLHVEPHPGVWHLVSTVRGTLREDVDDGQLLRATFPPGSVTGAPKLRAVEVIARLEQYDRGAYTGAIGFASPSWGLEFNVAIRTFQVGADRIELGVGGGVTADSVPMLEWQECLHKATPLLGAIGSGLSERVDVRSAAPTPEQLAGGLLETVLVVDGRPVRLGDHLARLDRSCRELYGAGIGADLAARAQARAVESGPGRAVLRLVVVPSGSSLTSTITCSPAGLTPTVSAAMTLPRGDGLWRHKWADRTELNAAEQTVSGRLPGLVVPLFVDASGAVLETSRGNVFLLRSDGSLVTPPLDDGVLPGVTRSAVLDLARDTGRPIELRPFDVAELRSAAAFWTSSLSLAVPIRAVDGVALQREDEQVTALSEVLNGGRKAIR
ncbi:MAG TPA: aminodeoxychorismate synthase component I [Jatrophihabitantaceae bacterium]|nr:aminodeoxychorismate synthase component I [Jatrophihabitantaceae bacterium]